jgi:hypothetical protein
MERVVGGLVECRSSTRQTIGLGKGAGMMGDHGEERLGTDGQDEQ